MATPQLIFQTARLRARPMMMDDREPFVAYRFTLAPAHQGRGHGTEALRALLDMAFGDLRMHRLIAVTSKVG